MSKCDKCGKDISQPKDYGCYILEKQLDLCFECSEKWIEMRKRHDWEEEQFLVKK